MSLFRDFFTLWASFYPYTYRSRQNKYRTIYPKSGIRTRTDFIGVLCICSPHKKNRINGGDAVLYCGYKDLLTENTSQDSTLIQGFPTWRGSPGSTGGVLGSKGLSLGKGFGLLMPSGTNGFQLPPNWSILLMLMW